MAEAKTKCRECGAEILVKTAERTGGVCMPCHKRATEPPPEAGKKALIPIFPEPVVKRIEVPPEVRKSLLQKMTELSRPAEPLPMDALQQYLAEATHRCELLLGSRPKRWGILFDFLYYTEERPELGSEIEVLLDSPTVPRLSSFLMSWAICEVCGEPPNPFEPMIQICRHGGTMSVAGDGLLDLEDYTGYRLGIPIASTFDWERRS